LLAGASAAGLRDEEGALLARRPLRSAVRLISPLPARKDSGGILRLAVIGDGERPSRASKLLLRAVKELGHSAYYVPLCAASVGVSDAAPLRVGGHEVRVDGALLRALCGSASLEQYLARYAMLKQAEMLGVTMVNSVDSVFTARNKYLTLLLAREAGVPVPDTVLTESLPAAYRVAKSWGDVVLKPILGSRGVGSVRFSDADLAFSAMRVLKRWMQPLMVQRYVEKPGRDIRAFVVGSEVVAAMYRYAPPGSWKTNIAQGGRGAPCALSGELEEVALRAAEALKLDYAGVDIAEGPEGPLLLEVNATADFEELMRVTGVNIPRRIVSRLVERIKR